MYIPNFKELRKTSNRVIGLCLRNIYFRRKVVLEGSADGKGGLRSRTRPDIKKIPHREKRENKSRFLQIDL